MKHFSHTLFFICSIFIVSLSSCKMDLIEQPTKEPDVVLQPSDYSDEISAPQGLTATQGGCKTVQLSWNILPNAVQYQIFSAETPFDTFTQIAETADNSSSIEITEKSGITKYYKIKAVNYFGTVSDFSEVIMGTTLATPLITSIESTDNGTVATVHWWMENCTKSTYQDTVKYIITCFEEDGVTVVNTVNAEGNVTSATFEELEPHTNYVFQVEAFLSSDQDNVEKSDILDAETARRLIPNAVEDFSAAQGVSSEYIELSWKIPAFVDYALGKNSYEQHPVYFTLERKPLKADDSAYRKIISYIGAVSEDEDIESDQRILIDCEKAISTSKNLTISTGNGNSTELYPTYISDSTLTYKDYTVERGCQYTYRITSYVDDSSKTISSDNSIMTGNGWLICKANFNSKINYNFENDTVISKASITFTAAFNNLGIGYSYLITEQFIPFRTTDMPDPISEAEHVVLTLSSISEVCSASKNFDCKAENLKTGNYKYRLYIVSAGTSDFNSAYTSASAIGYAVVVSNKTDLPQISWFEVSDGYKDKFILSWEYKASMQYSYKWIPIGSDEDTIQFINISDNSLSISETTATYSIPAQSNDSGRFILSCKPKDGTGHADDFILEDTYYTLGTANPVITTYYYDKIQVKWPVVQRSLSSVSDYAISAYYLGDSTKKEIITADNTSMEKSGNEIICTISNPEGYNISEYSGKAINLQITAHSSTTNDSTISNSIIRTLGPAAGNTRIVKDTDSVPEYTNSKQIVLSWDEVPGISLYKVLRVKYSYDDFDSVDKTDVYEIKKENSGNITISIGNSPADSSRITVTYDSVSKKYTLIDKYKEDDENGTNSYKANQSKLSWGIPFGYLIFPENSTSDISFGLNELSMDSTSKLQLATIEPLKAATYGYGINLKADKAVDGNKQTLTWNKPYNCEREPFIYRKEIGATTWEYVPTNIVPGASTVTFVEKNNKSKAYDYIVNYNSNAETTVPTSFLDELEKHMDEVSPTEPLNKGYLLALDFKVSPGHAQTSDKETYYREKLEWDIWDYSKRAIGPNSINIYILNKNFAEGWKLLCTLDSNCRVKSQGATLNDVYMEKTTSPILYIAPDSIRKGTKNLTDGDLKVLRDTKHFFKMELTSANGKTTIGEDESIYTYRQITDDELVRCVGLVIADSLHRMGIPYRSTYLDNYDDREIKENGGFLTISYNIVGAFDYKNNISWKFSNYKHSFINGYSSNFSSKASSPFTLDSTNKSASETGLDQNMLFYLPTLTIKVTSDSDLSSHNGTLTFTVGSAGNSVKYTLTSAISGRSTISESSESGVKTYFPFTLGKKQESGDSSINSDFLIYQSPWWN